MQHTTLSIGDSGAKAETYFLSCRPDMQAHRRRPAVIVCPGGGYKLTSDSEAEPVAIRLNSLGFHACVLRYSVAPKRFPTALTELAQTLCLLRTNADAWHIDPHRIFVMGFSAGGHLAASLGVFWQEELLRRVGPPNLLRPDGLVLCYPVITAGKYAHRGSFQLLTGETDECSPLWEPLSLERRVTKNTPPCFLWHTVDDDTVPVENSLLMASALQAQGVPFELHLYPHGVHGLSLANEETGPSPQQVVPACQNWVDMAARWMRDLGV